MSDAQVEVARARGAAGAAAAGSVAARFGSGEETAAQLDARLETQFGSGEETAAQLASHFGSGEETAAQLAARAKGGRNGKGVSKPGSGNPGGRGSRKRNTKWPPGTVMAWCPNCGAAGGKGHNQPRQKGEPQRYCGCYSLSGPPAPLR
jgi:hypothetical protein